MRLLPYLEAGFAVTVVDTVEQCSKTTEDINGVTVKHVKLAGAFSAARFKRWAVIKALPLFIQSTLLLLGNSADFYHAHDATALPACYIAAKIRGKPLIFDAHELPLSELDHAHRRWARTLLTPFLSHMIASCAGGIGASPYYEQNLRNATIFHTYHSFEMFLPIELFRRTIYCDNIWVLVLIHVLLSTRAICNMVVDSID